MYMYVHMQYMYTFMIGIVITVLTVSMPLHLFICLWMNCMCRTVVGLPTCSCKHTKALGSLCIV